MLRARGNGEGTTPLKEQHMPRITPDLTLPSLAGKRVLITGASDGMGLGMARRLAQAGAD